MSVAQTTVHHISTCSLWLAAVLAVCQVKVWSSPPGGAYSVGAVCVWEMEEKNNVMLLVTDSRKVPETPAVLVFQDFVICVLAFFSLGVEVLG